MEVPPDVVVKFGFIDPIADIPALRGPYGLQGLLPAQSFSPSVGQVVDFQFRLVVVLLGVFKVFTQDKVRMQRTIPPETNSNDFGSSWN